MTYSQLIDKLRHNPITQANFHIYIKNISGLYADVQTELELLKGAGAPLLECEYQGQPSYTLSTFSQMWRESDLVFVDIETNGAKPQSSAIIEIGALKVLGGEIIDRFESYVYAPEVPPNITKLTGICYEDIANAPDSACVLAQFREFLGGGVFIAHNVNFDYSFIDHHLRQCGLFGLLNPKLCTLELAKKTILSPRYALAFLNEFLALGSQISHRAFADALTSYRLFEIASMMFPDSVKSLQDMIGFSKGWIKYP